MISADGNLKKKAQLPKNQRQCLPRGWRTTRSETRGMDEAFEKYVQVSDRYEQANHVCHSAIKTPTTIYTRIMLGIFGDPLKISSSISFDEGFRGKKNRSKESGNALQQRNAKLKALRIEDMKASRAEAWNRYTPVI